MFHGCWVVWLTEEGSKHLLNGCMLNARRRAHDEWGRAQDGEESTGRHSKVRSAHS